MGCRAEIRTRDCLTESKRAPTEPHCTPSKIKQPSFTYSSYLKGHGNKVFCLWFSAIQEVLWIQGTLRIVASGESLLCVLFILRTINVDFLRIEYMILAKYQHMSILELILIIKQHILILCKKNNPCYQVGFCTEIHIHKGNMSSLVGNVVSNKCCLCVQNLLSSVNWLLCMYCTLWTLPHPLSQQHKLSWELRKFSLQKKASAG